jgi:hypothetical protein
LRADFGDALRALGDHDEIDHDDDREHDQADGEVAADQEVAERLDHVAGGARAGVALHQHHAGGRDVERQAQQGGDQQHRGERGEVQRAHQVGGHHHHHQRHRDVEREEQVQHERRQRQHHHGQHHDDEDRRHQRLADRAVASGERGDELLEFVH